jgi:hypothetical protein
MVSPMTEDSRDLAMFISVDIEGTVHIECKLPNHCIEANSDGSYELDLPIPNSVAPKIGKALLDAGDAIPWDDWKGISH